MQNTKIEWCDKSWNPIVGCSPISEGCANCYAKQIAETRLRLDFSNLTFHPKRLDEVTQRQAPKKIFVCSMSDLFHENNKFEIIKKVIQKVWECNQHTFLILTKRPQRMKEFWKWWGAWCPGEEALTNWGLFPFRNLWLGVTAENQKTADERIPILLEIPAAIHFVSCEPLLEKIEFRKYFIYNCPVCGEKLRKDSGPDVDPDWECTSNQCNIEESEINELYSIDWVIAGGETGKNARPSQPDWFRKIRDDCEAAGVPFFFKQWGEWLHGSQDMIIANKFSTFHKCVKGQFARVGKKLAGNVLDGKTHLQFPEV